LLSFYSYIADSRHGPWLTESQQASREVAETIIAHQTGSLTERAYNRADFLEQRRELIEA